ncbi:MAG: energy-coupling factor transporter transmembrane protein EcfT [Actinobacteria bacterium]|nr:energy-coupling factor transporter transmembrane protein EcfT [Actinomycetota bacterium]
MELHKNTIFGFYREGDSLIHKIDPRIKVILLIMIIVFISFIKTFSGIFFISLFLLLIIKLSNSSFFYILKGLKPVLPIIILIWIFQVIFYIGEPGKMLFQWNFIKISVLGIKVSCFMMLKAILIYFISSIFFLTTEIVSFTDAIERLILPLQKIKFASHEIIMVGVIAFRFVPTLVEELERLMKAQIARGADLDKGNFIVRAIKLSGLLIPLFISAYGRAEDLVLAMESRCYRGGKGRTRRIAKKLKILDFTSFIFTVLFFSLTFLTIRYFRLP